ncbi:hypothetical protein GCM10017567_31710 [Amycolatopsis bullii]|uniref:Uncharacterized protein n=1 Tax=Amycolatopsis bullii TaxID=941987 RepID=A0ABQ3KBN7_9PSEU|nr:hypothetical protein GCM10017567_31710 [Amycolatopsis bullii]
MLECPSNGGNPACATSRVNVCVTYPGLSGPAVPVGEQEPDRLPAPLAPL